MVNPKFYPYLYDTAYESQCFIPGYFYRRTNPIVYTDMDDYFDTLTMLIIKTWVVLMTVLLSGMSVVLNLLGIIRK